MPGSQATSGVTRPLVSVLVPAWNAERSIVRAIESVLADDRPDIECVVVDDGSTDATADVARAVGDRDARVRVLELGANAGVSEARNRGLDAVRGTWLTFLDADDRLLPGGLAALMRPAETGDALAVVGQRIWSDGRRSWVSSLYAIPDIQEPGRKSVATHPGLLYYASATGKLFHRSTWDELRFYGRVLGDQPWTIRALLRAGDRVEVIGEDVYEWSRPAPGEVGTSITSTTRASAHTGVLAAEVAIRALSDVTAEATALLDPSGAAIVSSRYVERLLRSDLGVHLSGALRRHDPATAELVGAIEGFVGRVPSRDLAGSQALARDILEPLVAAWPTLDLASRAATRSLMRVALAAPGIDAAARSPVERWGMAQLATGSRIEGVAARVVAALRQGRRIRRGISRRIGVA